MFFKRKHPAPDSRSYAPDGAQQAIVEEQNLRLAKEVVDISKRSVPTEKVVVNTITEIDIEPYAVDLRRENYRVERVAKNDVVTDIPTIRKVDGVTIIPVLEERLVTIKEIVLREEIHLHPEHSVETEEGEVELRRQRAVIDREPLG